MENSPDAIAAYQRQQDVAYRYNAIQTAIAILSDKSGKVTGDAGTVLALAKQVYDWTIGTPTGAVVN